MQTKAKRLASRPVLPVPEVEKVFHSRLPPEQGSHLTGLHTVETKLKNTFAKHPRVVSVYVYGSAGTKRIHAKSDLDLFIILKDGPNPTKAVQGLVSDVKKLGLGMPLDLDICFESEAKHFLHRGSAQYQYFTVGRIGRLVYGKPSLKTVGFGMKQFYLSVATLSQKIRHEVVNKFGEYAPEHFRKDVIFKCGSLAYEDPVRRRFHPAENLDYVFKKYPLLGRLRGIVTSKQSTLEELWIVAETLRVLVEKKIGRH